MKSEFNCMLYFENVQYQLDKNLNSSQNNIYSPCTELDVHNCVASHSCFLRQYLIFIEYSIIKWKMYLTVKNKISNIYKKTRNIFYSVNKFQLKIFTKIWMYQPADLVFTFFLEMDMFWCLQIIYIYIYWLAWPN